MPRRYHSSSSIKLGHRCRKAWALTYLDGRREPDVPWARITAAHSPRVRGSALGKDVHSRFERWYDGGKLDARGLPGQIALDGARILPHPTLCDAIVESEIGTVRLPPGGDAHSPTHAIEIHGVRWAGFRDLLAWPGTKEARRLGLPFGEWVLHDHKTTASIERYALSATDLLVDVQANVYGLATCEELDVASVPARWAYYETKATRRALPVDVRIERSRALDVLAPECDFARELDTIATSADAEMNPAACFDYGSTCYHHHTVGGPCNARRSVGALVQARVIKRGNPMTPEEIKAKIAAMKAGKGAPASVETEGDEGEGGGETPAPAPRRGRPPGRAAKPAAKPAAEAPSGDAGVVLELAQTYAAAQAAADEAKALLAAALA